nr:hypothetical protein [Tanacetum cinerariifolium]
MAFVSSSLNNSNSSNGVNTAYGVNTANRVNTASSQVNAASALNIDNLTNAVICAFLASQPNSTKLVNEDLEQIHPNDLEEMDLNGMLQLSKKRPLYKECWAPRGHDNRSRDAIRKTVPVETPNSSALVSCDGIGGYDWSDQAEEGPTNYALMAYSTQSVSSSDSEGLGYNAVPPPHTCLFPPLKSNLSFTRSEELFNKPNTEKSKDKSNEVEPESVRKHSDAPIIEDWVSDDEEEEVEKQEVKSSINRINFVKATTNNNPKVIVKTSKQPKQNTHRKRGNQRNWNGMMSHTYGVSPFGMDLLHPVMDDS